MGRRVVYVLDDDATILSAVRDFLVKKGFEVHGHTLWSEIGRSLLSDRRDAVLVCEVNLSGIRGEEFCRTVLAHRKNVRVLLWSSGSETELRGASERLGGVAFASKMEGLGGLARRVLELGDDDSRGRPRAEGAAPAPPPTEVQVGPYLLGPMLLAALPVTSAPLTIGRGDGLSLVLPSPMVSRRHVTLRRTGERTVEVEDHGSINGTAVDGHDLQGDRVTVTTDATLDIGPYRFDLRVALTREDAALRAAGQVIAGSSSLTVPGEKLAALLFFLAASELEGKLTFLEEDADGETSRAWTGHVSQGRLVRARYREAHGALAVEQLHGVCASVTFSKARVDPPQADAPRLLDIAGRLGDGSRPQSDPPTWILKRPTRSDPGATDP